MNTTEARNNPLEEDLEKRKKATRDSTRRYRERKRRAQHLIEESNQIETAIAELEQRKMEYHARIQSYPKTQLQKRMQIVEKYLELRQASFGGNNATKLQQEMKLDFEKEFSVYVHSRRKTLREYLEYQDSLIERTLSIVVRTIKPVHPLGSVYRVVLTAKCYFTRAGKENFFANASKRLTTPPELTIKEVLYFGNTGKVECIGVEYDVLALWERRQPPTSSVHR